MSVQLLLGYLYPLNSFNISLIYLIMVTVNTCLTVKYSHGYTSVLDMNTAQDGAKIWDKIHHEGKCVKLFWSSQIKYTVWELYNLGPTLEKSHN